jgi:hypothetical protein
MAVKASLKLLVRPVEGAPFGEWEFVWATKAELKEFNKQGFRRVKKVKLREINHGR